MNRSYKRLIFYLLIFTAQFVSAQNTADSIRSRYFKQRDFGKYFISDIYSPTAQVQVGMGLNKWEYNIAPDRQQNFIPFIEADFGEELPIFTRVKYSEKKLKWKFAISSPLCAKIWFDFTEPYTAPILTTDYQFAVLEFNFLKNINKKYVKNYAIKFIPFFHESTHIGDEITLYRKQEPIPYVWVNVSYQAAELAFTINDANGKLVNNTAFKIGVKCLLNPNKGWYAVRTETGDTARSIPTNTWVESYLQIQNQANRGFLASDKFIRIFSCELRERVQYGYDTYAGKYDSSKDWAKYTKSEKTGLCFNGYFGWKFNFSNNLTPRFGAYLKAYAGINPYGQFRNISDYRFLGISIVYEN